MDLRFISGNKHKLAEAQKLLAGSGINLIQYSKKINELQVEKMEEIIYDKALKAFNILGKPFLVEHTSLFIEMINDLPGGLTQIFWDKLEADKICDLFKGSKVVAKTIVAYCDSKTITNFQGEIEGIISDKPKGPRDFQWDCIFIPNGYTETFAEMGDRKNDISMRKIAFEKLLNYLK